MQADTSLLEFSNKGRQIEQTSKQAIFQKSFLGFNGAKLKQLERYLGYKCHENYLNKKKESKVSQF